LGDVPRGRFASSAIGQRGENDMQPGAANRPRFPCCALTPARFHCSETARSLHKIFGYKLCILYDVHSIFPLTNQLADVKLENTT